MKTFFMKQPQRFTLFDRYLWVRERAYQVTLGPGTSTRKRKVTTIQWKKAAFISFIWFWKESHARICFSITVFHHLVLK